MSLCHHLGANAAAAVMKAAVVADDSPRVEGDEVAA
jgi:hypothetical protein